MSETKLTTLKPTPEEAKDIRKTFNIVGLMLILQLLIYYFDYEPMTFIYGLVSGASGSLSDILAAGTEFNKAHGVVSRIVTTFWIMMSSLVPTFIGCKLMGINIKDFFRRDTFTKTECKEAVIFGCGVNGLILVTTTLITFAGIFYKIFSGGQANKLSEGVDLSDNSSTGAAIIQIIYISLLAPICEELFCRGFLLHTFKKYGTVFAMLMSGLIFGLMHQNLFQLTYTVIVGISLAMMTVSTKSIIPSIIVHIFTNFLGALSGPIPQLLGQPTMMFSAAIIVIKIVFFFMLFSSYRKLYGKNGKWRISKDTPEEKSRSWKYMCTSLCLPMILVLVYFSLS